MVSFLRRARSRLSVSFSCLVLASGLAACGSSTTTGTAAGSNTGADASTGTSGGTTPVARGAGLTGTWDLLATGNGTTQVGSVILSSSQLVVSIGGDVLSYKVSGTVLTASWTQQGRLSSIPVTRIANKTSVSYGAIPLALDGTWSFGSDDDQITVPVFSGFAGAIASNDVEFPSSLPEPYPRTTYQAERTETDDSIFGDLGGIWIAGATGEHAGCAVEFKGSDFVADCQDTESVLNGDFTLTFDAALSTASGMAGSDIEISAQRR
jgi:hypothetical protein